MSMVIIIDIPLIITTTYWTLIIDGVQCILHIFSFFFPCLLTYEASTVLSLFFRKESDLSLGMLTCPG